MVIAFSWELMHPKRKEDWSYIVEIVILKFTTLFTLMALFLFVFCGQLLVVYHKKIVEKLKIMISKEIIHRNPEDYSSSDEIWSILSHFRILCEAKRQLFRDFRSMLTMNCCLSVVNLVTCSYFAINRFFMSIQNYWLVVVWDMSDTLEFTFRLWLICHTADRIRSSVSFHVTDFLSIFYIKMFNNFSNKYIHIIT